MKLAWPKTLLNISLLLVIAACFTACKPELIPNRVTPDTTSTGADTSGHGGVTVPDTVPSFYNPTGIAIDATGNIFVADYGNNLIRKITPGGVVSTFAGSGNQGSIDAAGLLASFNAPTGITIDASGNLFVGDAGSNRIRKITPDGTVSTFAGSDSTGFADGPAATATFFHPEGVAADHNGNIFVADAGNNLIRKIAPDGTVSTIAGAVTPDVLTSVFSNPTGVATDAAGNVYVANYLRNEIDKISSGNIVSKVAGSDSTGAKNGPALTATFSFPNSLVVDAGGNIYVADGANNLIRKIAANGTVSTFAGSGSQGSNDGAGTAASFSNPAGIALDATGNLYVADSNNNLIRKVTPAGVVTTVAGSGRAGARNGQAVARRGRKIIIGAAPNKLHPFK
ncbi:MAG TPA: NHL repeat-containing protein [Mucilaginibacter sp.]